MPWVIRDKFTKNDYLNIPQRPRQRGLSFTGDLNSARIYGHRVGAETSLNDSVDYTEIDNYEIVEVKVELA